MLGSKVVASVVSYITIRQYIVVELVPTSIGLLASCNPTPYPQTPNLLVYLARSKVPTGYVAYYYLHYTVVLLRA